GYPPGMGVGGVAGNGGDETTPLLKGVYFPTAPQETAAWSAREVMLLGKMTGALESQAQVIEIEPEDIEALGSRDLPPPPGALAVIACIEAADEEALAKGDFRVLIRAVSGPSGAPLLGRFCHADAELHRLVERHLRAEESHRPGAIFAEIAHMPEGRLGN